MKTTHYYFMRHGEIAEPDRLAGHTDFAVSELGIQQMRTAAYGLSVDRCITSPLLRCQRFAKEFAVNQDLALNHEPLLREMNFGLWDGKTFTELWQMPSPNIGDFWQTPNEVSPPDGESLNQFSNRIEQWWQAQLTLFKQNQQDEDILVVTHAGVIKQIVGLILGVPQTHQLHSKIGVQYGSVVTVKVCSDEKHPPWVSLVL